MSRSRLVNGSINAEKNGESMISCAESHPPLTTTITAAPLALPVGRHCSGKNQINRLTGLKSKASRPLKMKRHRAARNFLARLQ